MNTVKCFENNSVKFLQEKINQFAEEHNLNPVSISISAMPRAIYAAVVFEEVKERGQ